MSLANQYSYVLISLAGILGLLVLFRVLFRARPVALIGAGVMLAAIALGLFVLLRPRTSDVDSAEAAERILANGRPTLVEFFSNYCAGCMGVRPAVDTLIADLDRPRSDEINILRVDIHTTFGRELRERYGFTFTPEFVLFDSAGAEVWRSHSPPTLTEVNQLVPAHG